MMHKAFVSRGVFSSLANVFGENTEIISSALAPHIIFDGKRVNVGIARLPTVPSLPLPLSMARQYISGSHANILAGSAGDGAGANLAAHPKVRLELDASDRAVNLIEDRFDPALRARPQGRRRDPLGRGIAKRVLVTSPLLLDRIGRPNSPHGKGRYHQPSSEAQDGRPRWVIGAADGREEVVSHETRTMPDDLRLQFEAAVQHWRHLASGAHRRRRSEERHPGKDSTGVGRYAFDLPALSETARYAAISA